MLRQFGRKCGVVGELHAVCDQRALDRIGGQRLGLLIIAVLQAMFEVAQEHIGVMQFRHGGGFNEAAFAQCREHRQRRLLLQ